MSRAGSFIYTLHDPCVPSQRHGTKRLKDTHLSKFNPFLSLFLLFNARRQWQERDGCVSQLQGCHLSIESGFVIT